MCKGKSDKFFKWAFLVLLAIAVAVYAFDCRYRDVYAYGALEGKSVLLDTWTNDIIVVGGKDYISKMRYRIGKTKGSLYEKKDEEPLKIESKKKVYNKRTKKWE